MPRAAAVLQHERDRVAEVAVIRPFERLAVRRDRPPYLTQQRLTDLDLEERRILGVGGHGGHVMASLGEDDAALRQAVVDRICLEIDSGDEPADALDEGRTLDHHRRAAERPHPQEREHGVALAEVEAGGVERARVAAGELDDPSAGLLTDRAGPGREADQLGEALGSRLGEHDPSRTLPYRDDSFRPECRERLTNRAA